MIEFTTVMGKQNGIDGLNLHSNAIQTGWIIENPTVVSYVAPNQIKIVGLDWRNRIQKGTKIRYKQGANWKYGVVFADVTFSTDTIITLTGGSDFTVANAPITDFWFSNIENPIGWPHWFNYLPTLVGFSVPPPNAFYRFRIESYMCHVEVRQGTPGTSNDTVFTISLPVIAKSLWGMLWVDNLSGLMDNGVIPNLVGRWYIIGGESVINLDTTLLGAGWTADGNKKADLFARYEI